MAEQILHPENSILIGARASRSAARVKELIHAGIRNVARDTRDLQPVDPSVVRALANTFRPQLLNELRERSLAAVDRVRLGLDRPAVHGDRLVAVRRGTQ